MAAESSNPGNNPAPDLLLEVPGDALAEALQDAAGDDHLVHLVRAVVDAGRANDAVCALIAQALGLPARAVAVKRGHTSRGKLLLVDGLTEEEMLRRLGPPIL